MTENEKKVLAMEEHLHNTNIIDSFSVRLMGLNPECTQMFCDKWGVTYGTSVHGNWMWMYFEKPDGTSWMCEELHKEKEPIIRSKRIERVSYVEKELKYEDYGILAPDGEYFGCRFGDHESIAFLIIENKERKDDYWEWSRKNSRYAADYVVGVMGYIIIHEPSTFQVTQSETIPMTKAQKEFLFDYFMEREWTDEANALYKE